MQLPRVRFTVRRLMVVENFAAFFEAGRPGGRGGRRAMTVSPQPRLSLCTSFAAALEGFGNQRGGSGKVHEESHNRPIATESRHGIPIVTEQKITIFAGDSSLKRWDTVDELASPLGGTGSALPRPLSYAHSDPPTAPK
jgi:hypothetical protein